MRRITNFMLAISILVLSGCSTTGLFSELGSTDVETKEGHRVTSTTNMEDCTKTVIIDKKDGMRTKRTFPMDPELCKKGK